MPPKPRLSIPTAIQAPPMIHRTAFMIAPVEDAPHTVARARGQAPPSRPPDEARAARRPGPGAVRPVVPPAHAALTPMTSMFAALLVLFGCASEPPPTAPTPVRSASAPASTTQPSAAPPSGTTDGPAQPTGGPADAARPTATCCRTPSATAVVDAYTALTEALASDDEAGAARAVTALADAARAAGRDPELTEDSRRQADSIAQAVQPLAGRSIADIRAVLAELSVDVIRFARENRGGDRTVVAAWCPMAPGHWLQTGTDVRNPYYGAEMLSCGTLEALDDVK
ncbi:MAG: DUF3347 domain-containing protein [Deltaproteobacteria bacterium]|nr:MAG: DUF3347 domain-containing protein [Deltaproteobacteria bacterium]